MITIKGLYVHIPFCEKICTYCDFCKRVPKNQQMIWDYLHTLKREYDSFNERFETIYIGGGTPSMLNNDQLIFLLEIFKDQSPIEYTIEVNPESFTPEKGLIFKQYNVNRVSLGVQTFNEDLLKSLNRNHLNKDVFYTIESLKEIGLHNISVDLIFSLPTQTLDDVLNDLKILNSLDVKHVSYYELILEEKTVLYHQYKKGQVRLLDSDVQANMYLTIIKKLKEMGFNHYEVSNYAKEEKYESKHNLLYWSLKPYYAIGAGSFGFDGKYRYYHTSNISKYINDYSVIKELQTKEMLYQDYLIFGLRKLKGVSLDECYKLFKRNPLKDFPIINEFVNEGLLLVDSNYLKPTLKGIFLLNKIVEVFL